MKHSGNLLKMRAEFNTPVDYFLRIDGKEVYLNELLGQIISFHHNGEINCIHCGNKTRKSFNQGFCFNCLQTAPEADESVIRPELSKAQFGIARDMKWSEEHDLIDHFVYLSLTHNMKVGVTRHHQVPTRWIDQGAVKAIKLAKTPNRHIAGIIESILKKHIGDKTNWQAMLKDDINTEVDLAEWKKECKKFLHPEFYQYLTQDNAVMEISYPGDFKPDKIKAVGFDKTPEVEGRLMRIKGQYLLFEDETVLNIRKHNGYYVDFAIKG